LKNGELLGIFPEGTRVRDGRNRPVPKKGFVSFALHARVPLIPISIRYEDGPFGVGRIFSRVTLRFGKGIVLDYDKKYDQQALREIADDIMRRIYTTDL
jgi:1-acyl-sn-glycerol-3-phosphate acyltransferase